MNSNWHWLLWRLWDKIVYINIPTCKNYVQFEISFLSVNIMKFNKDQTCNILYKLKSIWIDKMVIIF